MKNIRNLTGLFLISALLSACGGGGGGGAAPPPITKWTGTKQLGVSASDTVANGISVDSNGNVYVAGFTSGGLDSNTRIGTQDLFLTMYNSLGTRLRTKQIGATGKITTASCITVDASGNVYIAGSTNGVLDSTLTALIGTKDSFFTKYDPSGNRTLTKQFGVASSPSVTLPTVISTGIAVDQNGNIYIVGNTNAPLDGKTLTGTQDLFLIAYDKNGNKLYTSLLGASGANTSATGVAVDAGGNVYVVGYTYGAIGTNTKTGFDDAFVTTFNPNGTPTQTKQFGVIGSSTEATGVTVDSVGNVYIAGNTSGALTGSSVTGSRDLFVRIYDINGGLVTTQQLGVTGQITSANSIAVDTNKNTYVAGSTYGGLDGNTLSGSQSQDFFLTKFTSTWTRSTKQLGVSTKNTISNGVAVDLNGSAYVTGSTTGKLDGNTLTGFTDFFISKYDSLGVKQ